MKIRTFKTYSEDLQYISFNILPTMYFEGFCEGDKCFFIGWLTWGMQFKW